MTFLKHFSFIFVKREKLKFIIKITLTLFIQSLYPGYFGCKRTAKEQQGNPLGLLTVLPSEGFTEDAFSVKQTLHSFPLAQRNTMAFAFKEEECCFDRHKAFAHISNCPVYFSMACPSAGPEGDVKHPLLLAKVMLLSRLRGCLGSWHW